MPGVRASHCLVSHRVQRIGGIDLPRNHFIALDSWRGICALMVAAGHLKTSGFYTSLMIATTSYRFVDFFFVLSGFVIAHAARDQIAADGSRAWGFLIRRIGRLWPLHLVLLLGFIGYQALLAGANAAGIDTGQQAFSGSTDLVWLPANIFLVQAWGFVPLATWNIPAWSISAEIAAYSVFAACFGLAGRRGWIPMLVIGVGALVVLLIAGAPGMKATYDIALARCLAGFVTGAFVHALWTEIPDVKLPFATALELATVVIVFLAVSYLPADYGILVIPIFAATVLLFAYEGGAVSRALQAKPGQMLGELSYSIYMVHALLAVCILSAVALAPKFGIGGIALGPVAHDSTGIVTMAGLSDAILVGFLALIVGLSMLSFRWIEKPWRERAKAMARRVEARSANSAV